MVLFHPFFEQVFITAVIGNICITCFFQLLKGGFGTPSAAAVEVDRRVFVGCGFVYAADDLVDGDVDRVVQMPFAKFLFGTDINPNGCMLCGLGGGYGFLRGCLRGKGG